MAAKKAAKKKSVGPAPCPDTPLAFFGPVKIWAGTFQKWASEVDSCYATNCGTRARRNALIALCKEFSKFAKHAKKWADDVEDCFQEECTHPPDHTTPPPPPF